MAQKVGAIRLPANLVNNDGKFTTQIDMTLFLEGNANTGNLGKYNSLPQDSKFFAQLMLMANISEHRGLSNFQRNGITSLLSHARSLEDANILMMVTDGVLAAWKAQVCCISPVV